jgi:hypothetical protein
MPVNFRDAAERHYSDAHYLHNDDRLSNADHLFGFASECALKAVMLGLGMLTPAAAAPIVPPRIHNPALWDQFIMFANSRNAVHYAAYLDRNGNPFRMPAWEVADRYNASRDVSRDAVEAHKKAATESINVMNIAIQDGVVS